MSLIHNQEMPTVKVKYGDWFVSPFEPASHMAANGIYFSDTLDWNGLMTI